MEISSRTAIPKVAARKLEDVGTTGLDFKLQASQLPSDDECGWVRTLPPLPPAKRWEGEGHADAVVLGAGYTGLAASRRLAELRPDWRIVVLEAQRVGAGASGRNAGFVVDLTDFAAAMAPEDTARYVRVARFGIDRMRQVVQRENLDCGWDEAGFLRAAATEEGQRAVESWPERLERIGATYTKLDAAAMQAVTGSSFYRSGLRIPGSVVVHPIGLLYSLAASMPPGVELYEESPVRSVGSGSRFELEVAGGRVSCHQLFVTINGYVPALGLLRREVFPLFTFASLSRVLRPEEQEALGGEPHWGVLAMDPAGSTVRRTADHRIFIRNTFHFTKGLAIGPELRAKARRMHQTAFLARFPMLPQVEFHHTWSGVMAMSRNRQPYFGELMPRLFTTAGFNGAGIAMGAAAGHLLADLACGVDSEPLADLQGLPSPQPMPPEPLRTLGGLWTVRRLNRQANLSL